MPTDEQIVSVSWNPHGQMCLVDSSGNVYVQSLFGWSRQNILLAEIVEAANKNAEQENEHDEHARAYRQA